MAMVRMVLAVLVAFAVVEVAAEGIARSDGGAEEVDCLDPDVHPTKCWVQPRTSEGDPRRRVPCLPDCARVDLRGANLSHPHDGSYLTVIPRRDPRVDFSGADFSNADLRGAKLLGVDLTEADLHGADLRGADLSEAWVTGSTSDPGIRGSDLKRADFSSTDLRGANLSGADLSGTRFRGADLRGAVLFDVWSGVYPAGCAPSTATWIMKNPCERISADFSGADLTGASLRYAVLRRAVLRGADLSRADLTDAILDGADLTGAYLRDAIVLVVPASAQVSDSGE